LNITDSVTHTKDNQSKDRVIFLLIKASRWGRNTEKYFASNTKSHGEKLSKWKANIIVYAFTLRAKNTLFKVRLWPIKIMQNTLHSAA